MGAWGLGVFENDSAADWIGELLGSNGTSAIAAALEIVASADDYIEVDEGSAALAAIEVLNLMKGVGPESVPDPVSEWVEQNLGQNVSRLIPLAKRALGKVADAKLSEVAQLWLEQDYDWDGMVADIRARLNA
jgi:hypothetical protein